MSTSTRLNALDAGFVYGESDRVPLHVGGLVIVEGAPLRTADGDVDLDRLRRSIAGRLHLVPRFRQRLVEVPFDQGRPVWADDDRFDIANHVWCIDVPAPGGRTELLNLFGDLQQGMLDRSRPLWDIIVVDGLATGDLAIIARIHHAMMDGAGGVELGMLLYDLTPDAAPITGPDWTPEPQPSGLGLVADAVRDRVTQQITFGRGVLDAARHPRRTLAAATTFGRALSTLLSPVDELPFDARVSPQRAFATAQLPLEGALATKDAYGVKLNDVVVAAVAGGLRRWCATSDLDPDSLGRLAAICPVDMRRGAEAGPELGNQVSTLIIGLPVGEDDPAERVRIVAADTARRKAEGFAQAADLWARTTTLLPVRMLKLAAKLQFGGLMANTNAMISNVRGPDVDLYVCGARLRELYPYFGVHDGMGLIIVAVSYAGTLFLGLAADPTTLTDLVGLADAIADEFAVLDDAVPGRGAAPNAVAPATTAPTTGPDVAATPGPSPVPTPGGRHRTQSRRRNASSAARSIASLRTSMR